MRHLCVQMKDAQQAQQAQLTGALREAQAEAKQIPELRKKLDAAVHECSELKVCIHLPARTAVLGSAGYNAQKSPCVHGGFNR